MKKTLVTYSSLTGNTKLVAESIFEVIEGEKDIVSIDDIKTVDVNSYDVIVIGYWLDKGTVNSNIRKFIKSLSGKDIVMFGTLGAAPDSEHADKARGKVEDICKNNNLLGSFLCRGKISPELVKKMGEFPLKLIHPLTPERIQRIEDAKPHPNKEDLAAAQEFIKGILNK